MLSKEDFNLLKSKQFCDNKNCSCYNQLDVNNIRIHNSSKGQVYCNVCKNRWVLGRSSCINTSFVESRNGKYRKDNARLIRASLCHSKKTRFYDAQAIDYEGVIVLACT
jgi:IS1 family transposase